MPLQSLIVVERLFPDILSGTKTSTIRWREARITTGLLRYICETDHTKTVTVRVTKCTDMPLSKAAAFLGKEIEWPETVMLWGMREHYPEIELDHCVQIIEHLPPTPSHPPQR